jgi:3-methyladenine DNA glycosylase Tag
MDRTAPPRRRPADLAGYLEALSRPVFQAGMNWRVIDAKWEGIREAFAGFDPVTGAYHFLWQVGEPVPDYDTWQAT